jgi:hypothetical protein
VTVLEEEVTADECGCDFLQIIHSEGDTIEIHHVAPDDGFEHNFDVLDCACRPTIERIDFDLHVVDHKDAELDLPLDDGRRTWSSSAGSTGGACVPSLPGFC